MTNLVNIEIEVSEEVIAKANSLKGDKEVNYNGVFERAIETASWVKNKQAEGKAVIAARVPSEEGAEWSDVEYLPKAEFDEVVTAAE